MDEGISSSVEFVGLLVNEWRAFGFQVGQDVVDMVHGKGNVMNSFAPRRDELGDHACFAERFHEFKVDVPKAAHAVSHSVPGHSDNFPRLGAKDFDEYLRGRVKIPDRNAYLSDLLNHVIRLWAAQESEQSLCQLP